MVIEATQWLTTPLPCAGQLGTWRLSDDVRRCIASQFATDGLAMWNWAIRFPNEPGALAPVLDEPTQPAHSPARR